jgi:hypothetical protein
MLTKMLGFLLMMPLAIVIAWGIYMQCQEEGLKEVLKYILFFILTALIVLSAVFGATLLFK